MSLGSDAVLKTSWKLMFCVRALCCFSLRQRWRPCRPGPCPLAGYRRALASMQTACAGQSPAGFLVPFFTADLGMRERGSALCSVNWAHTVGPGGSSCVHGAAGLWWDTPGAWLTASACLLNACRAAFQTQKDGEQSGLRSGFSCGGRHGALWEMLNDRGCSSFQAEGEGSLPEAGHAQGGSRQQ